MKQNAYDDELFFSQYSQMARSVEGLDAAGEWKDLRALLPDFGGKRVLDLGCGFGWHCRYAAEAGAASVLGIDLSEKMLDKARAMTDAPHVTYRQMAFEDLDVAENSFDVAISSLALHYTPDFAAICALLHRAIVPDGDFVFSIEHPIFTAAGPQSWHCDVSGQRLHWPVDRYFEEGRREAVFLGQPVVKYHRSLTTTIGSLLGAGFSLTALVEPQPDEALKQAYPGMEDEWRRPMMLIVAAKNGSKNFMQA